MERFTNVELIAKCINKLKLGKAGGPDGLSAEHFIHAHHMLVIQCVETAYLLFRLVLFEIL